MGQKIALFRESTPTFNVMYVMLNFVPPLFYCMRQNRILRVKKGKSSSILNIDMGMF